MNREVFLLLVLRSIFVRGHRRKRFYVYLVSCEYLLHHMKYPIIVLAPNQLLLSEV